MVAVLNHRAKEFLPSYDTVIDTHPHSPNSKNGFVLLEESFPHLDIDDEELFAQPLSQEDLMELADVDKMNEYLAELDVLEHEQELHYLLSEKVQRVRLEQTIGCIISNIANKRNHTPVKMKTCSKKNHNYKQNIRHHRVNQPVKF